MKENAKILWRLFLTFFKIGAFTFGGGYAMLPLIEHQCVDCYGWITSEELVRVTVLAESTPGPVAINCATFVGSKKAGIRGALAATFGVVLPSFLIILGLSLVLDSFLKIRIVENAFKGVKIAVAILILSAGLRLFKKMEKKPLAVILFSAALAAMLAINIFSLRFSTIAMLLIAAAISLAVGLIRDRSRGRGDRE